jgi:hypothetical protein
MSSCVFFPLWKDVGRYLVSWLVIESNFSMLEWIKNYILHPHPPHHRHHDGRSAFFYGLTLFDDEGKEPFFIHLSTRSICK